jgi:hypothetical protein
MDFFECQERVIFEERETVVNKKQKFARKSALNMVFSNIKKWIFASSW